MGGWSAVSETKKTHSLTQNQDENVGQAQEQDKDKPTKAAYHVATFVLQPCLNVNSLCDINSSPRSLSKIYFSYNPLLDMSRYWIKLMNVEPYMRFVCLLKVSRLISGDSRYSYDWPISNFQSKDLINIFDISFSHHKHNWTKWNGNTGTFKLPSNIAGTLDIRCCTEGVFRFLCFLFMI